MHTSDDKLSFKDIITRMIQFIQLARRLEVHVCVRAHVHAIVVLLREEGSQV